MGAIASCCIGADETENNAHSGAGRDTYQTFPTQRPPGPVQRPPGQIQRPGPVQPDQVHKISL